MARRIAAAFFCLFFVSLSGCGFVVADTESLLTPPTLSKKQAEVNAALGEVLNISDIVYRYPQRGDYRSPFLFCDMDGDGREEAVVFYAYKTDLASTRTKVLCMNEEGKWILLSDFSVDSEQVDFVQFANLLSADSLCMLIGWQGVQGQRARAADNFLGIYSLSGGSFYTEIKGQPYIEYTVQDFDGNGLGEVLTVEREAGKSFRVSLLRAVGRHIAVATSLPLSGEADTLLRMMTGELWDGAKAVYIDEQRIDTSYATEVVRVDRGGLTALAGGNPPAGLEEIDYSWENYTYTFRDTDIRSRDINADGKIEVASTPLVLPGNAGEGREDPLHLIPLMEMTDAGFDVLCNAVINEAEDYLVVFPEKWNGQVTVSPDDETDEWKFFLVDGETGELTVELLRIQANTAPEARVSADEILLGSRGTRHYIGYIPYTTGEPAAVTEPELRDMFLLP